MGSASIKQAIGGATEYLTAHPDEATSTDSPATARIVDGLIVRVSGRDGACSAWTPPFPPVC